MGAEDHVVDGEQGVVLGRRLLVEDVEAGAAVRFLRNSPEVSRPISLSAGVSVSSIYLGLRQNVSGRPFVAILSRNEFARPDAPSLRHSVVIAAEGVVNQGQRSHRTAHIADAHA